MTRRPSSTRPLVVLAVIVLTQAAAAALQVGVPAAASLLRDHFAAGRAETSLLLAVAPLGLALSVYGWGLAADAVGERRAVSVGMLASGLVLVAVSQTRSLAVLLIGIALASVGGASAHAGGGRALVAAFPPERHGLVLGLRHTAIPVGGAAGAVGMPAMAERLGDPVLPFAALGVLSIVMALAAAAFVPGRTPHAAARRGADDDARDASVAMGASPFRTPSLLLLGSGGALLALAQIGLLSWLPLWLHDEHAWSVAGAASALALAQLAGGAARVTTGIASDRLGIRTSLVAALAWATAAVLAVLALPLPAASRIALAFGALVLAQSWNGVLYASVPALAPAGRGGAAFGMQTTFITGAGFVAPVLVGAVVAGAGWGPAFGVLAAAAALSAATIGVALPRLVARTG